MPYRRRALRTLSSSHGMVDVPPGSFLVSVGLRLRIDGRFLSQCPHRALALREEHRVAGFAVLCVLPKNSLHRQHPDSGLSPPAREVPLLRRAILRTLFVGGTRY